MARLGVWAGLALMVAGVLVVVLIGQRMPVLLTGLGLFVTALLLPRLRTGVLAACAGAALLLAVSAVVVPPTFHRLIDKFSAQMEHFPDSPYGLITGRAVAMIAAHPLLGLGFDGFRHHCADPAYFTGLNGGDGGGANVCVQHPHNHYLQAAVEAGIPGLVLFGCHGAGLAASAGARAVARPGAVAGGPVRRARCCRSGRSRPPVISCPCRCPAGSSCCWG